MTVLKMMCIINTISSLEAFSPNFLNKYTYIVTFCS